MYVSCLWSVFKIFKYILHMYRKVGNKEDALTLIKKRNIYSKG